MNELKPEDVMRALECSGYAVIGALLDVKTGKHQLITTSDVASLLKKYQAENAEKDAEIERLNAEIGRLGEQCRVLTIEYPKIIRAEAITEFFERVCKEVEQTPNANEFFINAWKEKFEEIAKQLKGETE